MNRKTTGTRKDYEMAYRAFRKWWKAIDNMKPGESMMGNNAYYANVVRSYPYGIAYAALDSTKAKRAAEYAEQNPLWCGKWTFPKKVSQS